MIFKMVKTEQPNGAFNHGVSLFFDGDSDRQDAVIVSGVDRDVAWKLYQELNTALCNAGLAVQTKNMAANEVLPVDDLRNTALLHEVKKWKRGFYIVALLLAVSQWVHLYALKP